MLFYTLFENSRFCDLFHDDSRTSFFNFTWPTKTQYKTSNLACSAPNRSIDAYNDIQNIFRSCVVNAHDTCPQYRTLDRLDYIDIIIIDVYRYVINGDIIKNLVLHSNVKLVSGEFAWSVEAWNLVFMFLNKT